MFSPGVGLAFTSAGGLHISVFNLLCLISPWLPACHLHYPGSCVCWGLLSQMKVPDSALFPSFSAAVLTKTGLVCAS